MFGNKLREENARLKEELYALKQDRDGLLQEMLGLQMDSRGQITFANGKFEAEISLTSEDLIGKNVKDMVPVHLQNTPHCKLMMQAVADKHVWVGAWQIKNNKNDEFWLRCVLFPIKKSDGSFSHFNVYANNLTRTIEASKQYENLIEAMQRSMAVIEFNMEGQVLAANDLFLNSMGYSLEQIKGKHHRLFCPPEIYNSVEYEQFWAKLRHGNFIATRFRRVDSSGAEVWLEASYNPITNAQGRYIKVVKFATVITTQILQEREVAAAANVAFETSQETDASAKHGFQVMQDTANVMRQLAERMVDAAKNISELDKQSQMISKIIQSISSIADQTNLLALNAAIEAARAGDQGRGFAVVADEVRQLASRTSSATEEIVAVVGQNQNLTSSAVNVIQSSQKQAEQVQELVSQASEVINEIQNGAKKVVDAVSRFSKRLST